MPLVEDAAPGDESGSVLDGLATVNAGGHETFDARVVSRVDGAEMAVTVFIPRGAGAESPVPVILHSHGWSGTRTTSASGLILALVNSGYGVVSFDARGHGASEGAATIHNRDVEVEDVRSILDWIAEELVWVAREDSGIPLDIVAGSIGSSYGGGYQLMTASFDGRLDALVPDITWTNLSYSLAPNGALKSFWVDALYGLAKASGTRLDERIDRWYAETLATNAVPADATAHFARSSPIPDDIRAHVLLTQGFTDTLFNVNEAMANYRSLSGNATAAGYDIRLFTHLSGHVSPSGGVHWAAPDSLLTSPCGDVQALTLHWFDRHLKGKDTPLPARVSYALEDGTCVMRDSIDADRTATLTAAQSVPVPQGAGSVMVPLITFDGTDIIAGIPTFSATAVGTGDSIIHASLVIIGPSGPHVIDHQEAALRFDASVDGTVIMFDLNAVATRVAEGDTLALRLDGVAEQYFSGGNRVPGAVILEDVTITVPFVDA